MAFLEINRTAQALRRARDPQGHRSDARARAAFSCWSARRAAASRRCSTRSPGWSRSARAKSASTARSSTTCIPSKRDIAMVFQSYALYPNMTVAQNMAFGMEMRGVPKAERDKAVAEVAKTLQIEHLLDAPPEPALRRPAPARRDGPRAGAPAARVPVRRAALQPRRQAARRHAHRDQAPAPAARARRSSMSRTTRSRR